MPEPITIFTGAALVSALHGAFVSMACEAGVSRGVRLIGARLSLGRLDPNHDIARAARLAALNAAIHCAEQARAAAHQAGLGATPWTGAPSAATAQFEKAKTALSKRALAVRRDKGAAFAAHLPKGGYDAVGDALARLLAAEKGAPAPAGDTLAAIMLAETREAGGWKTAPEVLIAAFNDPGDGFGNAFPASIGALLKDPDFDPFFRIFLVLQQQATNANIEALLERFDQLAAFAAERDAAAVAIAGDEARLAAMAKLLSSIEAKIDAVKEDTAAMREGVGRVEDKVDALSANVEALLNTLDPEIHKRAAHAGLMEAALIEIARRIGRHVPDFDAALREFHLFVDEALKRAAEGPRASNHGAFLDDVLERIDAKFRRGEFDEASAEADRALAEWRRQETERLAEARAVGLSLLRAGLEQDRFARNAKKAAARIEEIARLELGEGQSLFADLRRRGAEYHEAGRDHGGAIDLEISVELARRCLDLAASADDRGNALDGIGISKSILGERGDEAALKDAVAAYRLALEEWTRDRVPLDWAMVQNNLGNALLALGERGDEAALNEAIAAFRAALEERTRERVPLQWATVQNNLGNALQTLGERGDEAALKDAIGAYRSALEEWTRERVPLAWATTQNNLGNALAILGQRGDEAALKEAIAAYRAALEERTRERVPLDWAMTQNNLGNALQTLGERGDEAALKEAIAAFRAALEEYTRERAPLQWAATQNNLGNALQTLGERGDEAALKEAIAAFRAALEERTRERAPLQWAMTIENLSLAQETEADRMADRGAARAAYAALIPDLEGAIREYEKAGSPFDVETASRLLARLRRKAAGDQS